MTKTLNGVFLITALLMCSENSINAFPFDKNNYHNYPNTRRQVDFDDLRFLSKEFNLSELSIDGIRCLVGRDPITKSEVLVMLEDYNFEAANGYLNASVTDSSGKRYTSEGYTIIIAADKDTFGAHLYFSNVTTTLCIIRYKGVWCGSWVYFTN